MVEIELDGQKVEVTEGSMVMHAAEKAGTYIPHFCYHKKLSIAANCRMCLVDVEKAPKPMPACATPVTQGMIVRTKTDKAIQAQKSVMEFLLINHPLDCPICDQGGECQLQDLAVGYGASSSRYEEEKRVVLHKDVGPLISMEEMSRCIHCTRCVRFGQEVAGVMELGMIHRGEHSEITTVTGETIDSELSGNMIDICPVGALTSKPFRYSARTWELSRRKSVSPHDSTGANLIVQVKNHKVMRVVPFENEEVNECWIADRDRFSYEALNGDERLTRPMLKQGGTWQEVDWQTALEYVANGLRCVRNDHGAGAIGALVSPHSTLEELYLAGSLVRGLGSENIDYRLRNAEFPAPAGIRWLGTSIASLSTLQRVLVVGSNLRKDHPLFAQRIRQAARHGCAVSAINSEVYDWAMPVAHTLVQQSGAWEQALASVAAAIAQEKGIPAPDGTAPVDGSALAIARSLLGGERKAILLGNAAAHHAHASRLLALAQWIGEQAGATVGYLTEAANTVGAQFAGAMPVNGGQNAGQMLGGSLKAAILLNTEPAFDAAGGEAACQALAKTDMVVTLSPFKANMAFSDVLLPIAPFTETSGSFVNAEGRLQSFHAVVRPLGETRPAWKVLRVLANLLNVPGFDFETSQDVLAKATGTPAGGTATVSSALLNNAQAMLPQAANSAVGEPVVASIYQLDGLVRRATSLQLTADARRAQEGVAA
ncbi:MULTISPECIES: NADH-quinone oxidoreductase subunit NuoG [Acidovorax]|jgi:NADH-quinone oxidoreductase subunit G|uniref:NADH-quinone oxidoreductase n=1 Tax=Acidovorax soli TaxID=592050 RepID=A0A1H3WW98_9BURK|nr:MULTISPECIES: NADH-quinone oxidoreductase subunit NuoG [Acidovorax]SDZ91403.1 NADH-quinone oxidoreductase subunit G [Acidovorax soli]